MQGKKNFYFKINHGVIFYPVIRWLTLYSIFGLRNKIFKVYKNKTKSKHLISKFLIGTQSLIVYKKLFQIYTFQYCNE